MKIVPLKKQQETKERSALAYILEAWDEATFAGVRTDSLATAALFTAISSLIDTYGEDAVAALAERLSGRIKRGEFTLGKVSH